jgi:hypothetical protein
MTFVRALVTRLSIGIACLVLGLPAAASDAQGVLSRVGSQIAQYPVVRAEFVQTKQMAALKRPLVTSGQLVFSKSQGILWQIERPYRLSYVLGETRIVEIGGDGARRVREIRDVPGLAQVGRVFRAMLGADASALTEHFDVEAIGDADKWSISLKPRQAQLAQYISAMALSGGRFVEEIRISEAGGDSTQIRFRNSQQASALSDAELALFGGAGGSR